MNWIDVIFSVVLSLIITLIFTLGFQRQGPWGTIWSFFLIIFLAVWAASLWLAGGPLVWGYAVVPVALVGVVFALIVSASNPPGSSRTMRRSKENITVRQPDNPRDTFNLYFWLVALVLIVIIAFGYFY